ncbi:MAG: serine/threonine protein kinase [Myxococcota bacterium]|nr:serine/threonine protein kinase [Myxococcota bacterium]
MALLGPNALVFCSVVQFFPANVPCPLPRGKEFARYELLCPIAEGGMACVWAARPRGSGGADDIVAIKTILPRFADDVRFRRMFLDEGRVAARIVHPNVARIRELGEEHGVLYMVMEYIDGDPLAKLDRVCRRAGTTVCTGVALRVLADACAGLHASHELTDATGQPLGLVHHDVSPHNILVGTSGVSSLIDFGIAKTASERRDDSFAGVLKGKIQYMAPEQAFGSGTDCRADVWAVGAILYFLLAGKPPYDGRNHVAILNRLAAGCPPLPLPSHVHPAVAAVTRMALAHAPENRYATADQLRLALEAAMTDAKVVTTSADVAAFSARHMAGRSEKRRHAIELAMALVPHLTVAVVSHSPEDRPLASPTSAHGARPRSFLPVSLTMGLLLVASAAVAGVSLSRSHAGQPEAQPDPPTPSTSMASNALNAIDESRLSTAAALIPGAASTAAARAAAPADSSARHRPLRKALPVTSRKAH